MTEASTKERSDTKKSNGTRMLKIRGFLTGKSRRERRKDRESSQKGVAKGTGTSSAASMDGRDKEGDDQSTVYGVDVDDGGTLDTNNRAAVAAKNSLLKKDDDNEEESDFFNENDAAAKLYLLKVVLLLMDAKTRRFELLQLEFDSVMASVDDVLSQIPVAVTEECLQEQTYRGITCYDGHERLEEQVLADFCKCGDVMVAIAQGMTAAECVKLALPILSDPKVIAMLKSSGIDASPWGEVKKNMRAAASETTKSTGGKRVTSKSSPRSTAVDLTKKRAPEAAPQTREDKSTKMKQNGGLANEVDKSGSLAMQAQSTKAASDASSPSVPVITFHPNQGATHTIEHATVTSPRGVKITATGSPGTSFDASPRTGSSKNSFLTHGMMIVALIAVLAALTKMADHYLSSPIKVGQVLPPGTFLHKCGVAGAIPGLQPMLSAISPKFDCDDIVVVVEEEKVTAHDKDGNTMWVILGTHHSGQKYCEVQGAEECRRGLHYLDSKHIVLSGTKITWVETFSNNVNLHPWPFEEKPIARTWRK